MFSQVLACLQQDSMDAKEAGNISAQVGASKAMVNHLKQIAHIDPMRDWEQALGEHFAEHTVTKAKIPRSGIWEEERERKRKERNKLKMVGIALSVTAVPTVKHVAKQAPLVPIENLEQQIKLEAENTGKGAI